MASPTIEQIRCVHKFIPYYGGKFNLDGNEIYYCSNGCGGVQTQVIPCNGNCRCGGEQ